VIVRLVGVLSHFIYLEDARNHKPNIHRGKTGKEHLRVQEHQINTAQDNSTHLVQQNMQRQKPETELHQHKNKWTQQTKQQHHESSDKKPNKPTDQVPLHQKTEAE
jgi:hypothetical protein